MPRDLFQPHHDDTPTRVRRAGIAPFSIAAHAVALGAAVLVPALAGGALPDPRTVLSFAPPELVVPVVPPPAPTGTRRAAARAGAPVEAPDALPPLDAVAPPASGEGWETADAGEGFVAGTEGGLIGAGAPIEALPPPPPPPVVRVGGDIRPPVKIRDVPPIYPTIAKNAGVQGIVIIEATIDATGRVSQARLLRSVPLLDEAALSAVRQWVFTPTLLNGQPTPVIMSVTVQFTLR